MDEQFPDIPHLVRDLMSVGVATCPPDTPIVDLTRLLLEKDLEAVVVLDENGHAAGVVSRDNLIRAYTRQDYLDGVAEDVMDVDVPRLPPDIPLATAAQIMIDRKVRACFMTHHAGGIEYPAACITYTHLLRHMAMREPADLTDLGIKAGRKAPLQLFFERRDAARKRSMKHHEE